MTAYLIDICAFLGVIAFGAGAYLEYGVGFSLMSLGVGFLGLSINAARINNVPDKDN